MQRLLALLVACALAGLGSLRAQEEKTTADDKDTAIGTQLVTIFASVEELREITVTARNGVVRLQGKAIAEEHVVKAEEVSAGIDGVVYVDNDIELVTDVGERLSPTWARLQNFATASRTKLPLYGIALAVFVVAWYLAKLIALLFRKSPAFRSNALLKGIVETIVRLGVVLVGLYLALEIAEATTVVSAVLGAAGVAGLALSFAFRDIIENYLASIILSLRQPFSIKDFVTVNGHTGKVIRLTSAETVLMTSDGNHIRIPNSDVFKGTVVNMTRNPNRRFDFVVGVGTGENLAAAQELGIKTLSELPGVAEDPAPGALVEALADSSVSIRFTGWVDQREHDFSKVRGNAIRHVKEDFDNAGVAIPSPTYELNVHAQPTSTTAKATPAAPAPERTITEEEVDLSVDKHIDDQIDQEKAFEDQGDDLLGAS